MMLIMLYAAMCVLGTPPSGIIGIPNSNPENVRGSSIDLANLELNEHLLATLRWQPGDPVDPTLPPTGDTEPFGFRLIVISLDGDGQPIESTRVEIAVPSPLISRRAIEPPVYTGSLSVDPDLRRILVVAGESEETHMWVEASEFTFQIAEAAESIELVRRLDRIGEHQGASIATGLAEGQRPLITSVERVGDEIVVGIAPWQPGEARAENPPATRRARLTADFREIIGVEAIPEAPPPAEQPADPPPSDPTPPPSEPE